MLEREEAYHGSSACEVGGLDTFIEVLVLVQGIRSVLGGQCEFSVTVLGVSRAMHGCVF